MMWRPARIGPGGPAVVVALGTQIDISAGVIFVRKGADRGGVRAGEVKIVG